MTQNNLEEELERLADEHDFENMWAIKRYLFPDIIKILNSKIEEARKEEVERICRIICEIAMPEHRHVLLKAINNKYD